MPPLTTLEEYCEKTGEDPNLLHLQIEAGDFPNRCWRWLFRRLYVDVAEMRRWREQP